MSLSNLISERCSIRQFASTQVEEEKLKLVLEAARLAPTARNFQPQRIYVLKSEEALSKIRSTIKYAFNAPIVFLVCANTDTSAKIVYDNNYCTAEMDACIVATHMMLQAQELGLGTLWVRGYNTAEVLKAFPLPLGERLVCILLLGYPAENYKPSPLHFERQELEKFVKYL